MTEQDNHSWLDEQAGPLVRPYAMTRGRTRSNSELDMITVIVVMRPGSDVAAVTPEHEAILRLCQQPVSVAEVAAHLDVPLIVAKVLVSDLIDSSDVVVRPPIQKFAAPNTNMLQAVLDGIRRL